MYENNNKAVVNKLAKRSIKANRMRNTFAILAIILTTVLFTTVTYPELFIKNKGAVLTRTLILDKIWDIDGDFVDENTLSVNIRRLRAKIEDDPSKPSFIKTVFGIGYIWGDDR